MYAAFRETTVKLYAYIIIIQKISRVNIYLPRFGSLKTVVKIGVVNEKDYIGNFNLSFC